MSDDALDRLMATLTVRPHAFAVCRIEPGWRLRIDAMQQITLHYVLQGSGILQLDGGSGVAFGPGSILLVPAGQGHSIAGPGEVLYEAREDRNCELLADGLIAFHAGEGAASPSGLTCVCGAIAANYAGALGLPEGLQSPFLIATGEEDPLRRHFDQMLSELATPSFGARTLTESLMKICLVTILRRQLEQPDANQAILAPLRDLRLAAAVKIVVDTPARPHTVASLADVAGMSRSAFAQRFLMSYGRTPIDFVHAVRLRHAAHLLRTTDVPIKVVAGSVGYRSRSQFSRAFSAHYELDPSTFRRMSSAAPEGDLRAHPPAAFAKAADLRSLGSG
jgi:AraC-like DNA-binding protein